MHVYFIGVSRRMVFSPYGKDKRVNAFTIQVQSRGATVSNLSIAEQQVCSHLCWYHRYFEPTGCCKVHEPPSTEVDEKSKALFYTHIIQEREKEGEVNCGVKKKKGNGANYVRKDDIAALAIQHCTFTTLLRNHRMV